MNRSEQLSTGSTGALLGAP